MEGLGRGAGGSARAGQAPVCASCASSLVIPPTGMGHGGAGAGQQPRGATWPSPAHVIPQADHAKVPATLMEPEWGVDTHMQIRRGV